MEIDAVKKDEIFEYTGGKTEQKNQFIELRAKGYSYRKIAKEFNISTGTLTAWDRELSEEIKELKALQLEELYSKYYMLKEARIEQLGGTLEKINTELDKRDFEKISTDKLLDHKMKYMQALQEEFIDLDRDNTITKLNAQEIIGEIVNLLQRLKSGEITKEQAYRENYILMNILKAYEASILEKKIDTLEAIIQSR
jgi:transposase-like protein